MNTEPDLRVSRNVRILLAARAAHQSDLAGVLDLDSGTMSRLMNGKRRWTLADLEAMAGYFEVSVAVFFVRPEDVLSQAQSANGGAATGSVTVWEWAALTAELTNSELEFAEAA